ncbi:hypothetical protein VTJ04DRAFT_7923 [Mycothermus thermophilus]|uniref:uncharacterized protein n=1 Tax=Humicola insolens TaxID=85995 RepID=UPI003741FBEC
MTAAGSGSVCSQHKSFGIAPPRVRTARREWDGGRRCTIITSLFSPSRLLTAKRHTNSFPYTCDDSAPTSIFLSYPGFFFL